MIPCLASAVSSSSLSEPIMSFTVPCLAGRSIIVSIIVSASVVSTCTKFAVSTTYRQCNRWHWGQVSIGITVFCTLHIARLVSAFAINVCHVNYPRCLHGHDCHERAGERAVSTSVIIVAFALLIKVRIVVVFSWFLSDQVRPA